MIYYLHEINIRIQISWHKHLMWRNLVKKEIRSRHCLRLHLKLDIFMLGNHITEQSLKPLLWIGKNQGQHINWNIYLPYRSSRLIFWIRDVGRKFCEWHIRKSKVCACVVVKMSSCKQWTQRKIKLLNTCLKSS